MGTRSVIARQEADGWRGRYVHWGGYPTSKVPTLLAIVERDGLDMAARVLMDEHYGWSSLDTSPLEPLRAGMDDGRFVNVDGYGVAYTTEQGQSREDQWITHDGDDFGTEWAYVLTDKGFSVFERVYGDEHATGMFGVGVDGAGWALRGFVKWGTTDDGVAYEPQYEDA